MTDAVIVAQPTLFADERLDTKMPRKQPDLHTLWQHPERLPACITTCAAAMRTLDLLGPLHWSDCPERDLQRNWGQPAISHTVFIAAELVKLNEGLSSLGHLWTYLFEHPAFISLLGFTHLPMTHLPFHFRPPATLPTRQHFTRMLRLLPNATLQFLLADSVQLIGAELDARGIPWGECISLDTKHILAWVQENNPKAYISKRYDKSRHPKDDPDCRLGCKRRHNQSTTPTRQGIPASATSVGEFYCGYGSGVVATCVPGLGQFVLAELTQPFDQGDLTYFFPLMCQGRGQLGSFGILMIRSQPVAAEGDPAWPAHTSAASNTSGDSPDLPPDHSTKAETAQHAPRRSPGAAHGQNSSTGRSRSQLLSLAKRPIPLPAADAPTAQTPVPM